MNTNSTTNNTVNNDVDFNMNYGNNFNPADVDCDEVINAVFVVDVSGSVSSYASHLNTAFNDFVERMQKSHVANQLFVSIVEFNNNVNVKSGFQPIANIPKMDFSKSIQGSTALYDAVGTSLKSAIDYRDNLENSGVNVKTLLFIITDGDDNASSTSPSKVKDQIKDLLREERNYFSFTSILFGVGDEADFTKAKDDMGIEHLAKIGNSGDDIRKMINFISASISSVSSGGGVPAVTF